MGFQRERSLDSCPQPRGAISGLPGGNHRSATGRLHLRQAVGDAFEVLGQIAAGLGGTSQAAGAPRSPQSHRPLATPARLAALAASAASAPRAAARAPLHRHARFAGSEDKQRRQVERVLHPWHPWLRRALNRPSGSTARHTGRRSLPRRRTRPYVRPLRHRPPPRLLLRHRKRTNQASRHRGSSKPVHVAAAPSGSTRNHGG